MSFDPTFSFGAIIASVIGILVSTVGFLIVRTLNHVEIALGDLRASLRDQSKRISDVEQEMAEQRGRHEGYSDAIKRMRSSP